MTIFIHQAEIVGLRELPYIMLSAQERNIEEHPESLRSRVRSAASALALMHSGSDEGRHRARDEFDELGDEIFGTSQMR